MTQRSPTARPYADRIPRVATGPLAPVVLTECVTWLAAQGYSPGSAAGAVNLVKRLSLWMQEVGAGVGDIDGDLLGRFTAAERGCPVFGCIRRFVYYRFSVAGMRSANVTVNALSAGFVRREALLFEWR